MLDVNFQEDKKQFKACLLKREINQIKESGLCYIHLNKYLCKNQNLKKKKSLFDKKLNFQWIH